MFFRHTRRLRRHLPPRKHRSPCSLVALRNSPVCSPQRLAVSSAGRASALRPRSRRGLKRLNNCFTVGRDSLACRLVRCFCLRQRYPPETRTLIPPLTAYSVYAVGATTCRPLSHRKLHIECRARILPCRRRERRPAFCTIKKHHGSAVRQTRE